MQNDSTKGSLGTKFEDFGAVPSEGLWGAIADSLDGKKKRKIAIWWWIGAAAVTLAAVGVVLTNVLSEDLVSEHHFANPSTEINPTKNLTVAIADSITTNELLSNLNDITQDPIAVNSELFHVESAQNTEEIFKENVPNSGITNQENEKLKNKPAETEIVEVLNADKTRETDNSTVVDENESTEQIAPHTLEDLAFNSPVNPLTTITPMKNKTTKWEMGIVLNRWNSLNMSNDGLSTWSDPFLDGSGALSTNVLSVKRPIGVKFHLGYHLTHRLRLVSGLSFEYTSYRIQNTVGAAEAVNLFGTNGTPIKQMNVGIPIGLEFDFIKRRRFQVGTGVGILNEFPFLETNQSEIETFDGSKKSDKTLISGYNFGFNFNLNAGLYLTEKMRIQASSGLRYYGYQHSTSSFNLPKRDFWLGGSIGMIWDLW